MTFNAADYVRANRDSDVFVDRAAQMFDFYDAKGRAIGYRCTIRAEFWVADETAYAYCKPEYVGRPFWRVHPHATRDGKDYGASLPSKRFFSEAEARDAATKMIAAYKAKMAKQFA